MATGKANARRGGPANGRTAEAPKSRRTGRGAGPAREAVAEAPRNSRRRIERGKRPGLSWRGLRDSPARIRAALGRIRGSLVVVGRVVLVCVICAGVAGLARLVERHVRTSEA